MKGGSEMPHVSVIIPTQNEAKRIARVVHHARRVHADTEVIVVDNGSTDGTATIAKQIHARVVPFRTSLGHDVGRAIGAVVAKGDVLLFIDGDMVVESADLRPFVQAVEAGVDLALNRHLGKVEKDPVHNVVLAKHAFNHLVNQAHLKGYSMTTIPHACSRRALEKIGFASLMVPPQALAMAYYYGLRVEAVHHVAVGAMNPIKRAKVNGKDPLERLIIGDHLEALDGWFKAKGKRGGYNDGVRQRNLVGLS
jgi:glycosyltransferase involved in cell wall biosynthesis